MRTRTRMAAVVAAAAATMSITAMAANAAASGEMAAPRCGVQVDNDAHTVTYHHCGDSWIWIQIDKTVGANDFRCVGPWSTTHFGTLNTIRNAWYDDRTCARAS